MLRLFSMDIYMKCGHLLMNKWALQNRKDVQKGKAPKCLITHENERERDRELAGTMINAHLFASDWLPMKMEERRRKSLVETPRRSIQTYILHLSTELLCYFLS
jgi:hypothetical protein